MIAIVVAAVFANLLVASVFINVCQSTRYRKLLMEHVKLATVNDSLMLTIGGMSTELNEMSMKSDRLKAAVENLLIAMRDKAGAT